MANRIITTERLRARQLYVHGNFRPEDIAATLQVHTNTIRSWIKKYGWRIERDEVQLSTLEMGNRIKRLTRDLLDDFDEKQQRGELISDTLVTRLEKLSRTMMKFYGDYDLRGSVIIAMDYFTKFLSATGDTTALKIVNSHLEAFYNSLRSNHDLL